MRRITLAPVLVAFVTNELYSKKICIYLTKKVKT